MEPETLDGEALVAAHKRTTLKLRVISLAFPLLMIAIVVGYLAAIARQIRAVDTTAVATETAQRLGAAWPELEGHLADIAKSIEPAFTAALDKQTEAMAPVLEERLQKDVEKTIKNAETSFSAAISAAIVDMETKQRETLTSALPELAEDQVAEQRVLGATREVIASWASDRFHDALDEHVQAMESIRATLKRGYTDESGAAGDPKAALGAWFELFNQQMGGESLVSIADDAAVRGKGGAKPAAARKPTAKPTAKPAPGAAGTK